MSKLKNKIPITKFEQLDLSVRYNYGDYLTWQFKERVELFRGKVFMKGPSPGPAHQLVVGKLLINFSDYFKRTSLIKWRNPQVFTYLDVRLPMPDRKLGEGDTVVQPDILVVLDDNKFDDYGCHKCPDLIVEVLPRLELDEKIELKEKFEIYQAARISEYWIIDPFRQTGIIYTLNKKGKYIGSPFYTSGQQMESKVIKGFKFDMSLIFPE